MKKIFTLLMAISICLSLSAQTTKTMTWGGSERQYLEYVPASYNANTPAPVLFVFHGLGDNMSNMFSATGFKAIADAHGWIVVTPQALEAILSLPIVGEQNIGTAWNSGVSATMGTTHIVVNEGVDDSGLMMAILDDLIANYNVDQSNVFCTGFSMGGFMSNRMAMEHGDRIKAIASVSGTIGNELTSATPVGHVSAMHIHGTSDGTVTYDDAGFNVGITVNVGLGAEATVEYWRNYNQCSATPVHTNYPDNVNDGKTFEQFVYEGGTDGTKTAFIKVTGGDHEWYYTPANDIDYATEIYNFFASCMGGSTGVEESSSASVKVYPNPVNDMLYVEGENIDNIRVFNALGQQITSTTNTNIPVSTYSEGLYTITITFTDGTTLTRKVMIK